MGTLRTIGAGVAVGAAVMAMSGCVVVVGNHSTRCEDGEYVEDCCEDGAKPPRLIGVTTEPVGPALASQLGVEPGRAVVVTEVLPGRPADRAGLQRYDVITGIDGQDGVEQGRLREVVRAKQPGEAVQLKVLRKGQPVSVSVDLGK